MTERRPNFTHSTEPVRSDSWGKTRWEDYLSTDFPDGALCTSAGCVAIRSIVRGAEEVVLTYTKSRYAEDKARKGARWEILGGHRDPVDPSRPDGEKELPARTVERESMEEGGFTVATLVPLGFRVMYNPPAEKQTGPRIYPEESYYAYYWATTFEGLVLPTDPEKPLAGSFMADRLEELVECGHMEQAEHDFVIDGVNAARRYYDVSKL